MCLLWRANQKCLYLHSPTSGVGYIGKLGFDSPSPFVLPMSTPNSPVYSPCAKPGSPLENQSTPLRANRVASPPPPAAPRKSTGPEAEPLDNLVLGSDPSSSVAAASHPVSSPSVPLTLRHRVAMLQCVADRWVLHQAQMMVARGVKEKSYRVMQGVRKRYCEAKAKVVDYDAKARVRSNVKSDSETD